VKKREKGIETLVHKMITENLCNVGKDVGMSLKTGLV
jgi:hypothetical protein